MRWAAGCGGTGPQGTLRAAGLLAVWGYTVQAWQRDDSADLSATMAALDRALTRAEQAQGWLSPRRDAGPAPQDVPFTEQEG